MRDDAASLEEQIDRWRSYLHQRRGIDAVDVAELEDHLREQIEHLGDAGLAANEAFLVAVKRIGDLDALSREFAREHSDRLWKQLVLAPPVGSDRARVSRNDAFVAFGFAAAAAALVKAPALFGVHLDDDAGFYARNAGVLVLPFVAGYFAWKRRVDRRTLGWIVAGIAVAAIVANVYPFAPGGSTEVLTALHLPIALWLVVGVAYAGGRWRDSARRMDLVRFTGELVIYYVLIALGGGVLVGVTAMIFRSIGIDTEPFFESWLLPCGAAGAVVIASWLVEAKQSVIENMAPVLTRLFAPLFAALLVAFLSTLLWTRRGIDIERDVLIVFDLMLVVVLGLLLYSISARDPRLPASASDVVQVVLLVGALLADAVALWAMTERIGDFGFSPNRVAALGENVVLLVNLAGSTVLYLRFLAGRGPFAELERWQTAYLPVYAAWAGLVVIVFPPLFRYV